MYINIMNQINDCPFQLSFYSFDSDYWTLWIMESLLVLRFPPPIKLTVNDITEILLKVALSTKHPKTWITEGVMD
jgi:hypothetical protein